MSLNHNGFTLMSCRYNNDWELCLGWSEYQEKRFALWKKYEKLLFDDYKKCGGTKTFKRWQFTQHGKRINTYTNFTIWLRLQPNGEKIFRSLNDTKKKLLIHETTINKSNINFTKCVECYVSLGGYNNEIDHLKIYGFWIEVSANHKENDRLRVLMKNYPFVVGKNIDDISQQEFCRWRAYKIVDHDNHDNHNNHDNHQCVYFIQWKLHNTTGKKHKKGRTGYKPVKPVLVKIVIQ